MPSPFRLRLSSPAVHTLLFVALALPYCIHLGTSSLWDANESFYAETPREMLETGDYVSPRFNYQPRAQKPPLTYWLVLISYKLFGISEFSVRLPGALAAFGVILFTYGIGRALFSPRAGMLAAIIIGTTARFFVLARKLPIDILLLFWLTGAAYFLIRVLERDSPSWRNWAPLYFFLGAGFLTKGPIAWVLPVATFLLWSASTRKLRLRALRPLPGCLLLAATVLPWHLVVYWSHGWEYIASFFVKDNLGRFATETFGPSRGPFFYLGTFFADFFPWSVLALPAAFFLWSQRKTFLRPDGLRYAFPLLWCGFLVLFFSLSKNKQEYYIAPLYPVLAALLGGILERGVLSEVKSKVSPSKLPWALTFFALSLVLLVLSVLLVIVLRAVLPESSAALHSLPSAALLAAALALAWHLIRAKLQNCLASLAVSMWVMFLLAAWAYIPAVEPLRPVKEMCAAIARQSRPQDEVGYFVTAVPSMVFYLRRPVFEEFSRESMERRFRSPNTVFCILTEEDYGYFVGTRDLILYVLDRRQRLITQLRLLLDEDSWAAQELLLVSNQPAREPALREGRENP